MLHLCAAIGRHDEIVPKIEARFGGISDTVLASASAEIAGDMQPDLLQDIQRILAVFKGHMAGA